MEVHRTCGEPDKIESAAAHARGIVPVVCRYGGQAAMTKFRSLAELVAYYKIEPCRTSRHSALLTHPIPREWFEEPDEYTLPPSFQHAAIAAVDDGDGEDGQVYHLDASGGGGGGGDPGGDPGGDASAGGGPHAPSQAAARMLTDDALLDSGSDSDSDGGGGDGGGGDYLVVGPQAGGVTGGHSGSGKGDYMTVGPVIAGDGAQVATAGACATALQGRVQCATVAAMAMLWVEKTRLVPFLVGDGEDLLGAFGPGSGSDGDGDSGGESDGGGESGGAANAHQAEGGGAAGRPAEGAGLAPGNLAHSGTPTAAVGTGVGTGAGSGANTTTTPGTSAAYGADTGSTGHSGTNYTAGPPNTEIHNGGNSSGTGNHYDDDDDTGNGHDDDGGGDDDDVTFFVARAEGYVWERWPNDGGDDFYAREYVAFKASRERRAICFGWAFSWFP